MFNLMPFTNFSPVFKQLDDMEKELFGDLHTSFSGFRTDIKEEDGRYVLKADLPGFSKEDIKLEIKDNVLGISAEHTEEKEVKEERYIRKERRSGSFRRYFDVTDVDTNNIEASYNNGVLELTMPKLAIETPEVKQIELK